LKSALKDSTNLLPVNKCHFAANFDKEAAELSLPLQDNNAIRHKCGEYVFVLLSQLLGENAFQLERNIKDEIPLSFYGLGSCRST